MRAKRRNAKDIHFRVERATSAKTRYETRMTDPTVVIIGSFLLAFKAILIEGSEVAILSLATIKQLGRNNILFGVIAGGLGSIITFLVVWRIFLLLPAIVIDFATAIVLFYFSSRFLRGFVKYRIRHKSFREKMARIGKEVIDKDLKRGGTTDPAQPIRFSVPNSLPVLTITLTEGFEASLRSEEHTSELQSPMYLVCRLLL